MGRNRRPRDADVEIVSSVKAEKLTFHEIPQAETVFGGEPAYDFVSTGDRHNIPREVKAGVGYRDIRVDSRISAWLRDEELDAMEHSIEPEPRSEE